VDKLNDEDKPVFHDIVPVHAATCLDTPKVCELDHQVHFQMSDWDRDRSSEQQFPAHAVDSQQLGPKIASGTRIHSHSVEVHDTQQNDTP